MPQEQITCQITDIGDNKGLDPLISMGDMEIGYPVKLIEKEHKKIRDEYAKKNTDAQTIKCEPFFFHKVKGYGCKHRYRDH